MCQTKRPTNLYDKSELSNIMAALCDYRQNTRYDDRERLQEHHRKDWSHRETTASPGNRKKRLALKESQPLNVVRRTKCCAENRSFVWRPSLRTEGLSSSKEQSTLSGRKASATSRGRGRGCCGSGYRHRDRRN